MDNSRQKAEQIIADCIRFVYSEHTQQELALIVQCVKSANHEDVQVLARNIELGVPEFVMKAELCSKLFDMRLKEYLGIDDMSRSQP